MLIENTDAFYSWLTSCLGGLCDADPAALARYVMALVKKDKPENELKEFCSDQLDVFLAKETKPFVDILFITLKTKSYLQYSGVPLPPTFVQSNTVLITETTATPAFNGNSATLKILPSPINVEVPCSVIPVPIKVDKAEKRKDTIHTSPGKDLEPHEHKRFCLKLRERSSSGSSTSSKKSLKLGSRNKENEDKRHRRISDEEKHRRQLSRKHENRHHSRADRDKDRKDRESRRERERANHNSGPDGQKSRSPVISPSASLDRNRSRSRSASWSSRSSCSKDHPKDSRNCNKADTTQQHQSDHGDTDYRLVPSTALNLNPPSIIRSVECNKKKPVRRVAKRCKDYDEKGYCMRGDLCVFDHGTDPLVVEDVSVLNFGSTSQGTFPPEPYNPEAPGMFRAKQDSGSAWPTTGPATLPHPSGPPPPPGAALSLSNRIPGIPPFNPSEPPPPFHNPKVPRTRELIGVPTLDAAVEATSSVVQMRNTNVQQVSSMQRAQTNTTHVTNTVSSICPVQEDASFFKRKSFDYNRLGNRKHGKRNSERCSLELRKIPRYMNDIPLLHNHFSKFGPVKSVLVGYNNDPEAAVVEFTNHAGAAAAYRNSEAVLNNRFIKVFWHNKPVENCNLGLATLSSENSSTSASADQESADADHSNDAVAGIAVNKNSGSEPVIKSELDFEKQCIGFLPNEANMSRTVFNPAALKKSNINPSSFLSSVRRSKEDQRKETLRKRIELHKKMQMSLQSHVESQKMLVDRLAKSKSEKEKEFLKNTIEDLRMKIVSIQADLKRESEEITNSMNSFNGKVSNKNVAEKELLDAEMDLYNKQHRGDDVTELAFRVEELKQQALGIISTNEQRANALQNAHHLANRFRGRGRGRGIPLLGRSVDHRPRKIHIVNAEVEREFLKIHLLQFGEIESFEMSEAGFYVTYKTRKEAEMAFAFGSKLGNQVLAMFWHQDIQNVEEISKSDDFEMATVSEQQVQQLQLLEEEEEEEEEEDSEARSWRR